MAQTILRTYNKFTENTYNFNKYVFFNDVKIPGLSEIYVGVIKNIQIYSAQHMESKHCQDDIYIENHPLDG
jgi:hypothetical protein